MNRVHFIPTVDVEVFGDGSGCVQGCVVDPTAALLDVAEAHGARLTLFVDALGFSVMEARSPVEVQPLRSLLTRALERGHPLALHIHPQWRDASYRDGVWRVDSEGWRLGGRDADEVASLVKRGHAWLSELAHSVDSGWACPAFRAGALAVAPSVGVGPALHAIGVQVDSSVAPGRYAQGPGAHDFRAVPSQRWWRWTDDVLKAEGGPRLEVPIATAKVGAIRELGSLVRRARRSRFAHSCRPQRGPRPWWKLAHLGTAMLDFCAHPGSELIRHAQRWAEAPGTVPVCATGHSKNATATARDALQELLTWVRDEPDWCFSDYDEWRKSAG